MIPTMIPEDAKNIVDRYGSALLRGVPDDRAARYQSWLADPPELIMQAMKVELALSVALGSASDEFVDTLGRAVYQLPSFIDDNEARRLNAIDNECRAIRNRKESVPIELGRAFSEVAKELSRTGETGLRLWAELVDFFAAVKRIDANDSLYWQRILTLAGIEYSPEKERLFWAWLDRQFEARP